MNVQERKKELRQEYDTFKNIGEKEKEELEKLITERRNKIVKLKNNHAKELFDLEREYAEKKFKLISTYNLALQNLEDECEEKIIAEKIKYENARADKLCDIVFKKEQLEVALEEQINDHTVGIQNVSPVEAPPHKVSDKIVQMETTPINRRMKLQNEDVKDTDTFTDSLAEDGKRFLAIIPDRKNWAKAECILLRLNNEATHKFSNMVIATWNEDEYNQEQVRLVKGFNSSGGGYVTKSMNKENKFLLAPMPEAMFNEKIVVTNGYLYYFEIKGTYAYGAKGKVIKPAVGQQIDQDFIRVEKGVIELN